MSENNKPSGKTRQQREAPEQSEAHLRFVNSDIQCDYVLLRAELYKRLE